MTEVGRGPLPTCQVGKRPVSPLCALRSLCGCGLWNSVRVVARPGGVKQGVYSLDAVF